MVRQEPPGRTRDSHTLAAWNVVAWPPAEKDAPSDWLRSQSDGASFSAGGQATTFQAARVWLSLVLPGGSCRTIHRIGAYERLATPDLHVCGRRNGHDLFVVVFDWHACYQARTRSFVGGLHRRLP